MTEPTVTSILLHTAVKAIVPLAAKASIPAWRLATKSAVFEPRKLRRLKKWSELEAVRQQTRRIEKFLSGRLCGGLLEIYALTYVNTLRESAQSDDLQIMFRSELSRSAKSPPGELDELADILWKELTAVLRRSIDQLKSKGSFEPDDLVLLSRLNQERQGKSVINSAIRERHHLSSDVYRVRQALDLISEVRREGIGAYSEMLMPHARESHRVKLEELYVPRHLEQLPVDWTLKKATGGAPKKHETVAEPEVFDKRFVIIGSPGSGKSTFVRKLLYTTCDDEKDAAAPLILELKSWSDNSGSLAAMLASRLRSTLQIAATEKSVTDALILGMMTVIFDGLDEVIDISDRRALTHAIESFSRRFPLVRVVVTCRREGYDAAPLDPLMFPAYSMPDFTYDQITAYASNWFHLISRFEDIDSDSMTKGFIAESVHASELRGNPLMLSLLCILYQYEGYIPENRARVYEECAELLFGRWDRVRNVRTNIKNDVRGHHLVEEIAYYFFRHQASQAGEREMVLRALIKSFVKANIIEDDFEASRYAGEFLEHCAGRAWLLVPVGGSPRSDRLFAFSHRTFMEYFSACYMARFASNANELARELRQIIEAGSSDVICQIAIDRFGERNANGTDDVLRFLLFDSSTLEIKLELKYLGFVLRSLEFLQPTPRTVRAVLRAGLRALSRSSGDFDVSSLTLVPHRYTEVLTEMCETAIGSDSGAKADKETAVGARVYIAQRRTPDRSEIQWFVRHAKQLLVSKVLSQQVSLSSYRHAAGSGCLVDLTEDGSPEGLVLGPLPAALSIVNLAGFINPPLEKMLRMVADDPDSIMPMRAGALIELSDIIFSMSDWRQVQIFGARRPVKEQRVVGFTHVCAAIALEGLRHDMIDCVVTALARGFAVTEELSLDVDMVTYVHSALLKSPFVKFGPSWTKLLTKSR